VAKNFCLDEEAPGVANSRLFRRVYLDVCSPNAFLVSNAASGSFMLSAADQEIGRFLFIEQEPFDFAKLATVITLLDKSHKSHLLIDVGANIETICIPAVKRGDCRRAGTR
jgi:hypothetical protein